MKWLMLQTILIHCPVPLIIQSLLPLVAHHPHGPPVLTEVILGSTFKSDVPFKGPEITDIPEFCHLTFTRWLLTLYMLKSFPFTTDFTLFYLSHNE